jgi:2-iminobutanoate/2-iminopropanoate deaminase
MRPLPVLLSLLCCLVGCGPRDTLQSDPKYQPFEGPAGLPFSSSVQVGKMLFLSGQLGTDSAGRLVSGGIEAETRQAMDNIRAAVERGGSTMDRVVKCTAMLADMTDWAAMNRVYVGYFPKHLPVRSAFGASGLAMGARVEIECWAAMP